MKKIISSIFVALLALALVGCGGGGSSSELESKTYVASLNGIEMELTYYYSGDKVYKQTAHNVMPYSALGISTKEEAQAMLEPISAEYQGIEGLEEKIEYGDTEAVETLSIDYEKVDFNKLVDGSIPGILMDEGILQTKTISLKQSEELLIANGFTAKE